MSHRYVAAINKPGFNPLGTQTSTYLYGLYGWGYNVDGQLGLNNTSYAYSSPKQVGSLTNWSTVTNANTFSLAIKNDGTFWSWGRNNNGQLGLGNTTNYSSPKQIGALTSWQSVSALSTANAFIAIKTDGTLWSCGQNLYGCLGLGNTTYYSSPKQVGSLTNWSKISAGGRHAGAIKTNGTMWAWGYGGFGQLGNNLIGAYSSPIQIGALTTWALISCTSNFTSAIKTDGTFWVWGDNQLGQLGLGNTTNYSSPKQLGALTTWSKTSGAGYSTYAVKTDGTLWSWGFGGVSNLGLGNATSYSSPKQVGSLTNWATPVSGGNGVSGPAFCLKTDGTLWAWGGNGFGQLGLGDTTNRNSPVQVGALTTWGKTSCSEYSTIALLY